MFFCGFFGGRRKPKGGSKPLSIGKVSSKEGVSWEWEGDSHCRIHLESVRVREPNKIGDGMATDLDFFLEDLEDKETDDVFDGWGGSPL